jgi:hypothetical protein
MAAYSISKMQSQDSLVGIDRLFNFPEHNSSIDTMKDNTNILRVITYNVHNDLLKVSSVIAEIDPDIICLQEVNSMSNNELKTQLTKLVTMSPY